MKFEVKSKWIIRVFVFLNLLIMSYQLTKQEAIEFYNSKVYESWSLEQIAIFQLFQECLCVPFELFMSSLSHILKRSVYNHELAKPELLMKEYILN